MERRSIIGILIVILLGMALIGSVYWISKPKTPAGAATGGMSTDGFSSYEEMMAAHHGTSSGASSGVGGCDGAPTASHDSAPQGNGEMSEYGITYDEAGYNQLMGFAKSIKLNAEQTKTIVGLDIQLSCCDVKLLQASGNCECGHHVALEGLAKLLSSKGYSREQIQSEINKWKEVFFPGGAGGNTGGC